MKKILDATKANQCIKWTIFSFNLLFFLTGCTLIGLGLWLNLSRDDWQGISEYNYMSIANACIGVGSVIVLVAFFGCYGALTECKYMIMVFFVFLLIIFLAEVVTGVLAYVWKNELTEELKSELEKRIPGRYYTEDGVKTSVNSIQEAFECCGLYNKTDWSEEAPNMKRYIHQSCCIKDTSHPHYNALCDTVDYEEIEKNAFILDRYYSKGCYDSIQDFMEENLWVIAVVAVVFAGFQIIGMVGAMLLFCKLRKAEEVL